jgi:hypothetical protein
MLLPPRPLLPMLQLRLLAQAKPRHLVAQHLQVPLNRL